MHRYVMPVAVAVFAGLVLSLSSGASAGWFNVGSVGSGSSGSSGSCGGSGESKTQIVRDVQVGAHTVQVPLGDAQVVRVDDGKVVWSYGGNQLIDTQFVNVLGALGVVLPQEQVVGEWTCSYGTNGNVVVYQARHKTAEGLFVRGAVENEKVLKAVLSQITVPAKPAKDIPTTQPKK